MQNRACAEQGDARNRIKNRCFRTLILKLVNPLEMLEDRIAIHIDPFRADITITSQRYLKAKQRENWRQLIQTSTDSAT